MAPHQGRTPHGNTAIWRYTGLDKFLDLLLNQRLYFCATDELTDKYESFLPPTYLKRLRARWLREARTEDAARRLEFAFLAPLLDLRSKLVVNSWAADPNESYALWKIYLGGAQAGVAIRSTVAKLRRALKPTSDDFDGDLSIRTVDYGEPQETRDPTAEDLVVLKAPYYAYEREIRCFGMVSTKQQESLADDSTTASTWVLPPPPDPPRKRTGVYVSVDVAELIDALYVSPFVGRWAYSVIERLVRAHAPDLTTRIRSSRVRDA